MADGTKQTTGSLERRSAPNPSELRVLVAILDSIQFECRVPSIVELAMLLTGTANNRQWIKTCVDGLARKGLIERGGPRSCRTIRPKCRIEFFPESGLKKVS